MDFTAIMVRVGKFIQKEVGYFPYDKEIAMRLGLAQTQYSRCKKDNSLPLKNISIFCKHNRLSINWILFGQGSKMLDSDTDDVFKIKLITDNKSQSNLMKKNDENPTFMGVDKKFIGVLEVNSSDKLCAVALNGDSMEPTLSNMSIVLADSSKTSIPNGGLFVLKIKDEFVVKRVTRTPAGGIMLISDNQRYPPEVTNKNCVEVVGKVVGAFEVFR